MPHNIGEVIFMGGMNDERDHETHEQDENALPRTTCPKLPRVHMSTNRPPTARHDIVMRGVRETHLRLAVAAGGYGHAQAIPLCGPSPGPGLTPACLHWQH